MKETVAYLWDLPPVRASVILVAALIVGTLTERILIQRLLLRLTKRTETDLDDLVVEALRRPVFLTVVLFGLGEAADQFTMTPRLVHVVTASLETIGIVIWSGTIFRISSVVLDALSRRKGGTSVIQQRTLPFFDMLAKVTVIGGTIYFSFLAWQIDLTAWLASAGIIGIAVGFAAKDTLANLFSGIFIVADAPYKVGDYIVLDGELRGRVTRIGMRSTRILTGDNVEITVPNAVIGNSKIVTETGGPHIMQRLRVAVDAAYGSDIDQVREVLLGCSAGVAHVATEPGPVVHFRAFGASGLTFELLVWLEEPSHREAVLDALHCAIYKSFNRASIEIPYSKHDVYIKEMPAPPARVEIGGE